MLKCVENMEEILPNCWENDERMGVLFAPFRPRNLNPENYDSKMKFWQLLIEKYCEFKGEALFTPAELQLNFMRKKVQVQCLDTVLADLLKNYEARKLCDFEKDPFNSWLNWALDFAFQRPLSWSLDVIKKITGLKNDDDSQYCEYVHMKVLSKFCEILTAELQERQAGKVFMYGEFKRLANTLIPGITEEGLDVCLLQLKARRLIGVDSLFVGTENETKVIKIPGPGKKDTNLVQEDQLRVLWKIEDAKLQEIIREMVDASKEVKRHIKENNREVAKVHLRKKKILERKFGKLGTVLHNIEILITALEEAKTQDIIITAYKSGSKALKEALKASGLTYENVENVIAEMQDTLEEHEEIQDRIASAGSESSGSETEEQLEAELNEIINAEKPEAAEEDADLLRRLQQLDVVSDNPESSAPNEATLVPE